MKLLVTVAAFLLCASAANAAAPGLPDLIIVSGNEQTWDVNYDGTCAVDEGLIPPGNHRILTFSTLVANVGTADLKLGAPKRSDPLNWGYFTCHGHWHYLRWAEYTLRDGLGNVVGVGHKQSFCIEDGGPWILPQIGQSRYTCKMQGLSVGWYDLYSFGLVGQWIVVDGVPPGTYWLTQTVNYAGQIAEADYSNDSATVPVTIPSTTTCCLP